MHLDVNFSQEALRNKLALNALKYKLFKRHLNILLCWVHNYMKTPKTIAKRYKIKCNWEKYIKDT